MSRRIFKNEGYRWVFGGGKKDKPFAGLNRHWLMWFQDIKGDVGPAESLHFTEVKRPVPGPEQALVRVKAFGINRADIMQRDGEYPVPPMLENI
jgi:hypothetical protein